MMHWGNLSGMGYGGFGLGWIFMVLFWTLVIMGIVYLARQLFGGSKVAVGKEAADILKKRYAAGEITEKEYRERLTVISKQ